MKRIPLIAANWKMNMTLKQAKALVLGMHYGLKFPGDVDVVVAPPYTALFYVSAILKESYVDLAAQNINEKDSGAYTGEISGSMIKETGTNFVIVGHSERRQYFNETDELIGQKIRASLTHHLTPIFCIGESLKQRESGHHFNVVKKQLLSALKECSKNELKQLVIAYEPVWAIGTGKTATLEQINEIHQFIRTTLSEKFDDGFADSTRILYGGSVKANNSKDILSLEDVDGALVGGASLKAKEFILIIKSALK